MTFIAWIVLFSLGFIYGSAWTAYKREENTYEDL